MGRAGLWRLGGVGMGRRHEHLGSVLFGAELSQRAQPVFEVVSPGDLAIFDGLNINGQDLDTLAGILASAKFLTVFH